MKKRNLVIRTAIASAMLTLMAAANAGTMTSTNVTFAAENFGSTFSGTTSITPGAVTYSMSAATNVNANASITFVVRLTNGKFAAAPAAGTFTFAGAALNGAAPAGAVAGGVATVSTDGTTMAVVITNGSAVANLGLGAFSYTPAAGNIIGVGALGTVGSTLTATISVTTAAQTAAGMDSTNPIAPTLDAPIATATMGTSAAAIAATVSNLPTYTNKIDLTVTPAGSDYSLRAVGVNDGMSLGSVNFVTTAGRRNLTNAADYTLEAGTGGGAATATIVVTPGAGQSFPVGSVLSYDVTSNGCIAANQNGALAAITAATSTTAKTLTVTAANVTTNVPIFVCMTKPSTGNTATPITATLVGATVPAVTTDAVNSATGAGYAVGFNGTSKDVRTYIPATATGYSTAVRVINTGSVSAAISGAFIDPVTGLAGTTGTLIPSLAAGAATTLTAAQIETAIGGTAPAAATRPRLRITAPSNSLDVQSFILSPNGTFSEVSGAQ